MVESQSITTLTVPVKEQDRFESYRAVHPDDLLGVFIASAVEAAVRSQSISWVQNLQQSLRKHQTSPTLLRLLGHCIEQKVNISTLFKNEQVLDTFAQAANLIISEAENSGEDGHILYEILARRIHCNCYVIQLAQPSEVNCFEHSPDYIAIFVFETSDAFLLLTPKAQYAQQVWRTSEGAVDTEVLPNVESALQSMIAQIPESIETIGAYRTNLNKTLSEICQQRTKDLTEKIRVLRYVSTLLKSGQATADLVEAVLNIDFTAPPVLIDEQMLAQLVTVNLPDLSAGAPAQNPCDMCGNTSLSCFEYSSCGCRVCIKCIREDYLSQYQCPACKTALDSDAVTAFATELLELARTKPTCCMVCGIEPEDAQLCEVSCRCRLCASCVADVKYHCLSCGEILILSEIQKGKLIEEAACSQACSKCRTRKVLVCQCTCEACALESTMYLPVTGTCPNCGIAFDSFKLKYGKTYCIMCYQRFQHAGICKMPCFCRVCYGCLRKQRERGIEQCSSCHRAYSEIEKTKLDEALRTVYSSGHMSSERFD